MKEIEWKKQLSFSELRVRIVPVGKDLHILVEGGSRPHIGCTVLAVPRPSLTGDGRMSATSSVINVTGHKDETICRILAERAAAAKGAVTVCTGGFHADGITKEQIEEVRAAVEQFAEECLTEDRLADQPERRNRT